MLLLCFLRSLFLVVVSRLSRSLTFTPLRLMLGIAAMVLMPLPSLSQPIPRVVFPPTVTGNTFNFGSATANAANAANFSFGAAANGGVFANAAQSVPTAGGNSIPLNVGGTIPPSKYLPAFKRFARKALPLMSTGFALFDLYKDLGFGVDEFGNPTVRDPEFCALTNGCPEYSVRDPSGRTVDDSPWSLDPLKGCHFGVARLQQANPNDGIVFTGFDRVSNSCRVVNALGQAFGFNTLVRGRPASSGEPTFVPATDEQVEDAAKSRTPASPKTVPALKDALDGGESIDVPPEVITGPEEIVRSRDVETRPDGSVETREKKDIIEYAPPKVTVRDVDRRVIDRPGFPPEVTTVEGTRTQPDIKPGTPIEVITCGLPNTPACRIDETGTPNTVTLDIGLPKIKADTDAYNDSVKSPSDKGMFDQLKQFFDAPPLVQCQPFTMPSVMSMQIPSVDPCPVVNGVRDVMAFVWAFVGLFMGIGFIREAV